MRGGNRVTPGQAATSSTPTGVASPSTAAPTPSTGTSSSAPASAGSWRRLPTAPVPASAMYAGVWTGTDLLVFSPYVYPGEQNVFAAYRPATNTWRTLTASPYPVVMREGGEQLVWTGREMLAFGMVNAAYNPATKQWREISSGSP